MNTAIVIPARNEEQSIGLVLDEIPSRLVNQVIVVDNGSSDDTANVAAQRGATVVREDRPGYGAACLRGIAELSPDTDVIVILDGDHSDYPEDLERLLAPLVADDADFVIGSRVLGNPEPGALPWNQRYGNALACFLMRVLYRRRFTDMGPFRAMRWRQFQSLQMSDPTFGWNVEMQAKAIIAGMRIVEVPVRYRKRIGQSKISGTFRGTVAAGTKIIGTIFKFYPAFLRRRKATS